MREKTVLKQKEPQLGLFFIIKNEFYYSTVTDFARFLG